VGEGESADRRDVSSASATDQLIDIHDFPAFLSVDLFSLEAPLISTFSCELFT